MYFVDLSQPVEPNAGEPVAVEIDFVDHAKGADLLGGPAGLDRQAFPDGLGLSLELVRLASHAGTHVDAPCHYGPQCEGKPARSIDQMPLDWFFSTGVALDCRGEDGAGAVTLEQTRDALSAIEHTLSAGEIVLIETGADAHWGTDKYFTHFRGISREATQWLVEQGIRVIGVDSFGFDPPFGQMLEAYKQSGDQAELWPAHVYGREREYCQIERLANLRQLPVRKGFQVACFPIKLNGCGAGWSRVVAMIDDAPPS